MPAGHRVHQVLQVKEEGHHRWGGGDEHQDGCGPKHRGSQSHHHPQPRAPGRASPSPASPFHEETWQHRLKGRKVQIKPHTQLPTDSNKQHLYRERAFINMTLVTPMATLPAIPALQMEKAKSRHVETYLSKGTQLVSGKARH